jgi:hypothetical protein
MISVCSLFEVRKNEQKNMREEILKLNTPEKYDKNRSIYIKQTEKELGKIHPDYKWIAKNHYSLGYGYNKDGEYYELGGIQHPDVKNSEDLLSLNKNLVNRKKLNKLNQTAISYNNHHNKILAIDNSTGEIYGHDYNFEKEPVKLYNNTNDLIKDTVLNKRIKYTYSSSG